MCSVPRCAVPGCEGESRTLHSLPKEPKCQQAWLAFIFFNRIPDSFNSKLLVCSAHFTPGSFSNVGQYQAGFAQYLKLKRGAVPTLKGPRPQPAEFSCSRPILPRPVLEEATPPSVSVLLFVKTEPAGPASSLGAGRDDGTQTNQLVDCCSKTEVKERSTNGGVKEEEEEEWVEVKERSTNGGVKEEEEEEWVEVKEEEERIEVDQESHRNDELQNEETPESAFISNGSPAAPCSPVPCSPAPCSPVPCSPAPTARGRRKKEEGPDCTPSSAQKRHQSPGMTSDLVADLLWSHFSKRSDEDQLEIITRGRPTPQLTITQPYKGFVRHFQVVNYERYPWLTGSERTNRLYCYDCLLFSNDRGAWSYKGFANLSCLTKAALRHQMAIGHIQAAVSLRVFAVRADPQQQDEQRRREVAALHNEQVRKNREVLRKLVDCVVFLGKQQLALGGRGGGGSGATGRGNYAELLSFLSEHDPDLRYHLSNNRVFSEASGGGVQEDLIHSIGEVMGQAIHEEVRNAQYVAVMVDDISDGSNSDSTTQLSLVLRYVTGGGVAERFIRAVGVSQSRRTEDTAAVVLRLLEEHDCLEKVVAQCYDGTAVLRSGINAVQATVRARAPMALFIHSDAIAWHRVLTQGASKIRECKVFFSHLSGLAAFFLRSAKCAALLDEICERRLPRAAPIGWHHESRLVRTVLERKEALLEAFESILQNHEAYGEDAVRSADGYIGLLGSFDFCFLLSVFSRVLDRAECFFNALQTEPLNMQVWLDRADEFCGGVENERQRFDGTYTSAASRAGAPTPRRRHPDENVRARYRQLHDDVLDNIINQTRNRFKDHEKLSFLSLLDTSLSVAHRGQFPDHLLDRLKESHGPLFDVPRLKAELIVMYAMVEFYEKSPSELLVFLHRGALQDTLCQVYALVCLAVTLPLTATSPASSASSARGKIRACSRTAEALVARPAPLLLMAVESELLQDLKCRNALHDRVIHAFTQKESRQDFVFK